MASAAATTASTCGSISRSMPSRSPPRRSRDWRAMASSTPGKPARPSPSWGATPKRSTPRAPDEPHAHRPTCRHCRDGGQRLARCRQDRRRPLRPFHRRGCGWAGIGGGGGWCWRCFVLLLLARPADENHPYGHGRAEILTGLLIGLALTAAGALISYDSLRRLGQPHMMLAAYVVWPLAASLLAKVALASVKFHYGRKLRSDALTADAWNDAMDSVSAVAAVS